MAQIKIFGHAEFLATARAQISDAIHRCVVEVLALPAEKRFHRFLPLADADFIHPADRSERYIILEISMFEGRSVETKKQLIRALFAELERQAGISPQDVEITIFETPRANWGIRGVPADELTLNYQVEK